MMNRNIHRIYVPAVALFAVFLLAGCGGKNPEKQLAKWDREVQAAKQLIAANPAFAGVLEAEMTAAEKTLESAKTVSDAKEKAKKISTATKMLRGGVFGKLRRVKTEISEVRKQIVEAAAVGRDDSDRLAAYQAGDQAKEILAKAEQKLSRGASDPAQAMALLNETYTELDAISDTLDSLIERVEKKTEAAGNARKTTVGTDKTGTAAKPPPPPVAKMWTCEYCGGKAKGDAVKCPHCGAARKK